MSKCNKVKNPCKICLAAVSQKTGLQCQGACGTWVHYSCLNYTPGKIKDIKAGIIKVTCPCPDCKTTMPKEFRTDQPYSCNNQQCPANRPPKCENMHCPINEGGINMPPITPSGPPCPLGKCGADCKQHSVPQLPNIPRQPVGQPCVPVPSPTFRVSPMASDACFGPNLCPSGCSSMSTPDLPGDYGSRFPSSGPSPRESHVPSDHLVEQLCNTVGQLTNQINDLMCKMKQAVNEKDRGGSGKAGCPGARGSGGGGGGGGGPGGGRGVPPPGGGGACKGSPCNQPGSKQICPKPCFCPGNPVRRDY